MDRTIPQDTRQHQVTVGRALDRLYEHDVTALFLLISVQAYQCLGVVGSIVHLDSASFHVDGDYDHEEAVGLVAITQAIVATGGWL